MMMRALHLSSGLEAVRDDEFDAAMTKIQAGPDYHPNPNGYYLSSEILWPHQAPGKLMKVSTLYEHWRQAKPAEYMVVHMLRNEAERRMSWERGFGTPESDDLQRCYGVSEQALYERDDASIIAVSYADVIANPVHEFRRIAVAGWPINPLVAASYVDPTLYRNRL